MLWFSGGGVRVMGSMARLMRWLENDAIVRSDEIVRK